MIGWRRRWFVPGTLVMMVTVMWTTHLGPGIEVPDQGGRVFGLVLEGTGFDASGIKGRWLVVPSITEEAVRLEGGFDTARVEAAVGVMGEGLVVYERAGFLRVTVKVHGQAKGVGVSGVGVLDSVWMFEFGEEHGVPWGKRRGVYHWWMIDGEDDVKVFAPTSTCESTGLEVVQHLNDSASKQWTQTLPDRLKDWDVTDGFFVKLRYRLGCQHEHWTVLRDTILFKFGRADLLPGGRNKLREKAAILTDQREIRLGIYGHTDTVGSHASNDTLGLRRARAVRDYLLREGVDSARLELCSCGENAPSVRGHSATADAPNRRVEFGILSIQDNVRAGPTEEAGACSAGGEGDALPRVCRAPAPG